MGGNILISSIIAVRTLLSDPPPSNLKRRHMCAAFSLIELLVVIGLIGVVCSLTMPALAKARRRASTVQCQSNLRQLGIILQTYSIDNKGWLYPVGPAGVDGQPSTFGTQYPPHLRWPARVAAFQVTMPSALPYDPEGYISGDYNPSLYSAHAFTPRILQCPGDDEPFEAHTYVLNQHLADKRIRAGTTHFAGLTSTQVVVAGEKFSERRDYYMERADFERIVDRYRHQLSLGSNYLFHDGHVDSRPPPESLAGIDPWDPRLPDQQAP